MLVPRKRFRGQRRYYRALEHVARRYRLPDSPWVNLSHTHVDWHGHSNLGGRHRRAHLRALFVMLDRAHAQLTASGRPWQLWLLLHPDGSRDALYVHSENPHTPFPFAFEGVDWIAPPPALWATELTSRPWLTSGVRLTDEGPVWFVRPR